MRRIQTAARTASDCGRAAMLPLLYYTNIDKLLSYDGSIKNLRVQNCYICLANILQVPLLR